jgi:hypothetical protein
MGGGLSRLMRRLFKKKQARVLLLGLDAAGKTSERLEQRVARADATGAAIMLKMAGKPTHTQPTIGFNVETVTFEGLELVMWVSDSLCLLILCTSSTSGGRRTWPARSGCGRFGDTTTAARPASSSLSTPWTRSDWCGRAL